MKKELISALTIFITLVSIFFFEVLFNGKTFVSPDAKSANVLARSMQQDQKLIPQYCPYIFSGMPSFGSMIYVPKFLYAPNLLLQFTPDMIQHCVHYILAGLGMFLLLGTFSLKFLSKIVGAVAFMFTTNMIGQEVFGHGGLMMTASYIPIIFWSVRKFIYFFLLDIKSVYYLALIALFVGLQLQRSHIQIIYYTWMLVFGYYGYEVFTKRNLFKQKRALKLGVYLSGAMLFSIGLSAIKILPVMEYSPYSIRDTLNLGYATSWSLHPKEMITFILPFFYGFGGSTYQGYLEFANYPNYLGIGVIFCAVFAFVGKYREKQNPIRWFLLSVIAGSLLIAFGKYTPIYAVLFKVLLPFFDKFRVPMMILILVQFSMACLAAIGFQNFIKTTKRLKAEYLCYLLATFILADLWYVGAQINNPHDKKDLSNYFKKDGVVEYLEKDEGLYRVLFLNPLFNENRYALFGIESVGGYHAAKLKIYDAFLNSKNNSRLLSFLNTKYLVSTQEIKNIKLLEKTYVIYEGQKYYAFIYRMPDYRKRYYSDKGARIEVLEKKSDYAKLKVESQVPQNIIFSEIYYPAWRAYVNGERVPISKFKNLLMAAPIKEGQQIVELKFVSKAFVIGAIITILSWTILIGSFVYFIWRNHARNKKN